ncbi:MAG: S-layer homology domain-containing protein, partial [Tissierellia bacterium]|nr:S-layer homology domain-containing protein [Tissierellia bacterium]
MKKIISLTLAFLLILSGLIPIQNVYGSGLYEEAGNILHELGILAGDERGNLNLNDYLTREQMVVLLSRLLGEEEQAKNFNDPQTPNLFTDISKFYTPYIRWSVNRGLIKGMSANEFGFGQHVTVQQYQAVLLRALQYTEESNDWPNVPKTAEKLNLMENLPLSPTSKLTRGQMAVMTLNA